MTATISDQPIQAWHYNCTLTTVKTIINDKNI